MITDYVCDKNGKKTGVIINIAALDNFLDELQDMYDIAQAEEALKSNEKTIPHEEVMKMLTRE